MVVPTLEQHFATFRATRDPKALAAIFDAVAAELLLVAVHLVGDRSEAEDLVQITFVELIERADGYDRTRPLKPWLIGVLANRAKMAIRRRQRAPALDDAARPGAPTGPVEAAEAQEAAQHVARALEGLPSHYRQVLVLHLVHGLGGVQIAQALERSPATVRTQIKRGLELLRDVLPRALVVPAALLIAEGRGLAAVRSVVLDHAAAGTVAAAAAGSTLATAATAGGIIAMKKVVLAVVALSVGIALWFGLTPPSTPTPPLPKVEAANVPTLTTAMERSTVDGSDRPEAQREPVREPAAPTNLATVRGRLIAAWNDTPQTAHAIWITATPEALGQANSSTRLCTAPSGADGTFELSFVFAGGMQHRLEIYGKDFVAISDTLAVIGPGVLDLGDIRVVRGARIGAHVVDETGEPVPDVWFVIESAHATLGQPTRHWTGIGTDAHGYLSMRDDARVHPGEASLEAPTGYEILSSARFRVPDDADVAEPTIVVRKLDADRAIAGRVVDERGVGIANVRVLRRVDDRGFTRADGSFQVFRKPEDDVRINLSFVGSDTKVGVADLYAAWGTTDLVVVQRDAQTLGLRVVADDTGAPITGYKVHFAGSEDPMFQRFDLAKHWRLGPHADGRTELPGLPNTGRVSLIVAPDGDEYEMHPQVNLDLPRAEREAIVVRLRPRRPVSVRVVTPDGTPVAGSSVRLVQLDDGEALTEDTLVRSREDAWASIQRRGQKRWPTAFVVDAATTDAAGQARLRCALPAASLGILVTGAGHRPFRASAVTFGDAPFEVTVEPGASVRGRLRPADLIARFSRSPGSPDARCLWLTLQRPGQAIAKHPLPRDAGHAIAADGSFTIAGLEPGRWEFRLFWWRPMDGSSATSVVLEPPLASLDLAAGSDRDLGNLDAGQFAPATIAGRAFHRGAPVSDGLVTLTRRSDESAGPATEANLGGVRTDREGNFSLGGLLAGTYMIHVEHIAADGTKLTLRSEDVIVRRGVQLERAFDLQ